MIEANPPGNDGFKTIHVKASSLEEGAGKVAHLFFEEICSAQKMGKWILFTDKESASQSEERTDKLNFISELMIQYMLNN